MSTRTRRYLWWSGIAKAYWEISRTRALDLLDGPESGVTQYRITGNDIVFFAKGEQPK